MNFLIGTSARIARRRGLLLALVAMVGLVTWSFAATPAAYGEAPKKKEAPNQQAVTGEFASYENGKLTITRYLSRGQSELREVAVPENAKSFVWNQDENRLQPVETAEAMRQLKTLIEPVSPSHIDTAETMLWRKAGAGLVVKTVGENITIHMGQQKSPFVGTFGSFRDDFLLFHFKNPSQQFRKRYGDSVRLKMNEGIPVYESIDGGEYQRAGTPREVLSKVKEGENIAVYHYYKTETDEFYLVLVGAKKK